MTETKRRKYLRWALRLLAATAGVLALFLLVVASTVALLPTFLSTPWLKGLAEVKLSRIVEREVRIQTVLWTWGGGILVEGVEVADDPDFSEAPLAAIRKIRVRTNIRSLFDDRLELDFVVDGLSVHLVRKRDGDTNLGALLADMGSGGRADDGESDAETPSETALTLPMDVRARVHLRGMSLTAEDRSLPTRLALTGGEVRLDVPSLADRPVTLTVRSDLTLDGRDLDPISLDAEVTRLFGPGRRLTLNRMRAECNGMFPGVRLNVAGNMADGETGVNGRVSVDMPALYTVARPLLPRSLAGFRPEGDLTLTLDASHRGENNGAPEAGGPSGDAANEAVQPPLELNGSLAGRNLAFFGLPPDGKTLGPFDFALRHRGTVDAERGDVHIEKGAFRLLDGTTVAWAGEIQNAFGEVPDLDLRIGPADVDIREVLGLANPFLPAAVEPDIGDEGTDPPRLKLASLNISGSGGDGPLEIVGRDLDLTVPYFVMGPPSAGMSLKGGRIVVPTLQARLTEGFPETLSLSARIGADAYRGGKDGVAVSSLELAKIDIDGEGMRAAEKSPLGVSGRLRAAVDLTAGRCDIPGVGTLGKTAFSLAATAAPKADGTIDLTLEKTDLAIADLRLRDPGLNSRLSFGAAGGVRLRGNDVASLSLAGIGCRLDLGDMLSLRLDVDGKPCERVKTKGNLTLDLTRLQNALPGLFGQIAIGGSAGIDAVFDGRIPEAGEIEALSDLSGFDVRKRLAFLRSLAVSADLDGVTAAMPPSGGKRLTLGPLRTEKPLSYTFSPASGKGVLTTEMTVQRVRGVSAGLEGIAAKLPARLSLSVEHDGVEGLRIEQGLQIRSLPLDQELTLALGGLNRVLNAGLDGPPARWLRMLGGTVKGRVRLGPNLKGEDLLPDLDAGGELTAGLDAVLESGKRIEAGLSLRSDGMSLKMKDGASVAGLKTRLDLQKGYRLGFDGKRVPKTPDKLPLSVAVMGAEVEEARTLSGGAGRFMDRLRRRYTAEHPVSFDRALVELTPGQPPLAIENAMMDIGLKGGLPGSEFFQADLLGGTVMGALGLAKDPTGFYLRTDIAFTGIDSRRMLPGGTVGVSRSEGEIGGELALRLPLTPRMAAFMSGLRLTVTLSPIGSRALERILYALDPYESNESIVAQRRLLRRGTPRWVKARIHNGALSLTGEVSVSGARVAIPPIDRLNIENIGGLGRYEGFLAGMGPAIDLLEMLSAETLTVDEKGTIQFR